MLNLLRGDLQAGGQAFQDHDQALAVGFAGGQEAEHTPDANGRSVRYPRQRRPGQVAYGTVKLCGLVWEYPEIDGGPYSELSELS